MNDTQNSYSDKIERVSISLNPKVSVILPTLDKSRRDNVNCLLDDLRNQTFNEIEVILVKGISPHGKALNLGVTRAKGEYILILDDDSRMPNKKVIATLIKTLEEDRSIGMAGASIVLPPDANWFQKKATQEFPRFNMQIVERITESDMACHGCCALPKRVYEQIGGEREDIIRGLDPELRYRLRQAGYKTVLAPNCWIYHPLPDTFKKFLTTFFRNGMASAYCLKFKPESIIETDESIELKAFKPKRSFAFRLLRFPMRLIKTLLTLKFLRFLAYVVYGFGFVYGLLKYTILNREIVGSQNLARDFLKECLYSYHWDPSNALLRAIEARLISTFDLKEPILDSGCGDGTFASIFLSKHKIFGLDIRLKHILKAKKKRFYSGLIVSDARKLAFKNNLFKTILINSFLEHIFEIDLENVLQEVNRVLNKEGKALITINSKLFGNADPLNILLKKTGLGLLYKFWQRYRDKRLALYSLKNHIYWKEIFKKTNFRILESRWYLPFNSEKKIFLWTEIQYLGISRVNLGSIMRCLSKLLSYFGIDLHRTLTAELFSRILRKDYSAESESGSCLFFVLEKAQNDL